MNFIGFYDTYHCIDKLLSVLRTRGHPVPRPRRLMARQSRAPPRPVLFPATRHAGEGRGLPPLAPERPNPPQIANHSIAQLSSRLKKLIPVCPARRVRVRWVRVGAREIHSAGSQMGSVGFTVANIKLRTCRPAAHPARRTPSVRTTSGPKISPHWRA